MNRNAFERKLRTLSFSVKTLTVAWLMTLVFAAVYVWEAPASALPGKIETRELAIVDKNGVPRVVLGAPKPDPQINGKRYQRRNPSNGIQFNDSNGDEVGGIGMLDDGSRTFCFDAKTGLLPHERICVFFLPDGQTSFLVKDGNGKERAILGLTKDDTSEINLKDKAGNTRIRIAVEKDGTPGIEMFDAAGVPMPMNAPIKQQNR